MRRPRESWSSCRSVSGSAVRKEVASQMRSMGAATQGELDSLRKRVRDLERATGMTASGRKKTVGAGRRPPLGRRRSPHDRLAQEDRGSEDEDDGVPSEVLERVVEGSGPVGRRRLDAELVRRGLAGSRAEAQEAVRAGHVTVRGAPATKSTTLVGTDEALVVGGAGTALRLSRRGEAGGRPRRVRDRSRRDATASMRGHPRADSPTVCCSAERDTSSRWTWATASSRGSSAPIPA